MRRDGHQNQFHRVRHRDRESLELLNNVNLPFKDQALTLLARGEAEGVGAVVAPRAHADHDEPAWGGWGGKHGYREGTRRGQSGG